MTSRPVHLTLVLFSLALAPCAAIADAVPGQGTSVVSKNKPVMLTADRVNYDEHNAVATASGHVEVVQGETVLMADSVTYDQKTDTVHAKGHVSVLEPTGDVFFSNDAVLQSNMQQGVIRQFRARFKDNSLFAAREAHRVNKQITKLKDLVYSPCQVCQTAAGEGHAPLWQIAANKATIDENAQRVRYQNAFMDFYGVPILYSPYFSHPTPDAPSQSGLLQPQYYHDSILGNIVKEPVYYTFAPNLDLTVTPWYIGKENPLLEGELRGLTPDGPFSLRAAQTNAYNTDSDGNKIPGHQRRYLLEAHGKFQLDKDWDAGFDGERVSDNTFLQLYHFGYQDLLTSRLYAERIKDRDYFDVEALAFQGLQPQDKADVSPYILPQANLHLESDPLALHSRLTLDSNFLSLQRKTGDTDQRVSSTVAWKLPYITPGGQVFELNTSLRGDAYNVNNQLTDPATGSTFNGDTGRFIPQADLNWRYPFINRLGETRSLTVAPVVELTASPSLHNTSNIPNEDSQIAELSDVNLFSPDRFAGLDEVESGFRGTYGTRGQLQLADQETLQWLLGQTFQQNATSPFPISSAVNTRYSDYIGRIALKYYAFDLAYAFRLDRQTFAPTSNDVNIAYTQKPLTFDITYLSLQNEPLFGDRKEVYGNVLFDIAPHWSVNLSGRRDLGSSEEQPVNNALAVSALNPLEATAGTVGVGTGLIFHNECITVTTSFSRSYITQQDVKPSSTFGVTLELKNFGAQSPQNSIVTASGNSGIATAIGNRVDTGVAGESPTPGGAMNQIGTLN